MTETLLLGAKDLEKILDMKSTLKVIENVFRAHGQKKVKMPAKITLDLGETGEWPGYNAYINALPAYVGSIDIAGVKWVGGFWNNQKRGLPSIIGTIILNNPRNGLPLAIMDGTLITSIRTGAAAIVGAKYLATEPKTLAIIGAGAVGRAVLKAAREGLKLEEAKIFDVRRKTAAECAKQMSRKLDMKIKAADDVRSAVYGANIIVTATSAQEPLVRGDWVERGTYICALGSYEELDDKSVEMADKLVVDDKAQTLHRGVISTKIRKNVISENDIYAEIGEIVAGKKPGRQSHNEIDVFVPLGMGTEDVAVAFEAYRMAKKRQLGKSVRLL